MADTFRTMILAADSIVLARDIAASFGPGGAGMWITPLSASGTEPATHYISSGFIPPEFADLLTDPIGVWEMANTQGVPCSQDEVDAIFASADISEEEPFAAMGRLGLTIINPEVPL